MTLDAPFPWFGGKSRAAPMIWERLGAVDNYVEPFAGSLAVLLGAPRVARTETVNDADGFICNFWRAVGACPDEVARHADWPVNENDQHARHAWLVEQRASLTAMLEGDPAYCDARIAGWWAWGIGTWIGSGWCSGNGPWVRRDGKLVHLGDAGRGVHRQLVHLGNAQGVHRKRVHLGDAGRGGLNDWFAALSDRLRFVRVCCGDWSRVCGPTPTVKLGLTGVVLDPPYSYEEREGELYAVDSSDVAAACREWALSVADDPAMRIALCGYQGEHVMPGWQRVEWSTSGGYGVQGHGRGRENQNREVLWFSPHCLGAKQPGLFDQRAVPAAGGTHGE